MHRSDGVPASPAATVLYDDHAVALERIGEDSSAHELWIDARDLPRLGGFELTADGACRGDLCVPLPAGSVRNNLLNFSLLNFSAFAAAAGHAVVAEPAERIWSVSARPTMGGAMTSRLAPDMEVPDRLGRPTHLAGFRGRKALVITWASW